MATKYLPTFLSGIVYPAFLAVGNYYLVTRKLDRKFDSKFSTLDEKINLLQADTNVLQVDVKWLLKRQDEFDKSLANIAQRIKDCRKKG
ncbi:MAG: hypothetical protein Q9167_002571 [Letrouitia subvulpina]